MHYDYGCTGAAASLPRALQSTQGAASTTPHAPVLCRNSAAASCSASADCRTEANGCLLQDGKQIIQAWLEPGKVMQKCHADTF
jgi:hypothetical protein